jgi:GNAT superfamily N-acetyltransferase
MHRVQFELSCPVRQSFRVKQVAGMFDVPLAARTTVTIAAELPELSQPWQIGLIVGPSGSGKTALARHVFKDFLYQHPPWPADRAVIDCFQGLSIHQATGLLTAVGFGSPPAWIRPYHVLSGGERFRCDLARALASAMHPTTIAATPAATEEAPQQRCTAGSAASDAATPSAEPPVVCFDEFTSVVDRTVARVASAALARALRRGHIACRFVAVTCHYDVAEWLEPDWIIDMADGSCARRRLRRPPLRLEIFRARRTVWRLFARHHYLSGNLSPAARCYLGMLDIGDSRLTTGDDQLKTVSAAPARLPPPRATPVVFLAMLPLQARRGRWRISRVVTLPDYQGLGLGTGMMEAVAGLYAAAGQRVNITASHPAVLGHCLRSPRWRLVARLPTGARRGFLAGGRYRTSQGRAVASFEFVRSPAERPERANRRPAATCLERNQH